MVLARALYSWSGSDRHAIEIPNHELAEHYPCYGFKKLFQLLRRQDNTWIHML